MPISGKDDPIQELTADTPPEKRERWPRLRRIPYLLHGVLLIAAAAFFFLLSTLILIPALVVGGTRDLVKVAWVGLAVGGPLLLAGVVLSAIDLFILLPFKRGRRLLHFDSVPNRQVTVVLTAYNDELSIGDAVRDFLAHPLAQRVVVVDNNSSDRTAAVAREAGAEVAIEPARGYGKCVYRALCEAVSCKDTDLTLLCEGDMTFRAFDLDKFMAYIPHADIVNGTRIVEQLRSRYTQLTTFMFYGNFFVGKLLEAKHVGKGTFTDVGTTYKLCRNSALSQLLPELNSDVNLEFNAHFMDTALTAGISMVECPITFHGRIGQSKGGNTSNFRALTVGLRMIRGILFSWKRR